MPKTQSPAPAAADVRRVGLHRKSASESAVFGGFFPETTSRAGAACEIPGAFGASEPLWTLPCPTAISIKCNLSVPPPQQEALGQQVPPPPPAAGSSKPAAFSRRQAAGPEAPDAKSIAFGGQTRSNAFDPARLDPKRARRIVANRESAHRSRMKKVQYVVELEGDVQRTAAATLASLPEVAALANRHSQLTSGAQALREQLVRCRALMAGEQAVARGLGLERSRLKAFTQELLDAAQAKQQSLGQGQGQGQAQGQGQGQRPGQGWWQAEQPVSPASGGQAGRQVPLHTSSAATPAQDSRLGGDPSRPAPPPPPALHPGSEPRRLPSPWQAGGEGATQVPPGPHEQQGLAAAPLTRSAPPALHPAPDPPRFHLLPPTPWLLPPGPRPTTPPQPAAAAPALGGTSPSLASSPCTLAPPPHSPAPSAPSAPLNPDCPCTVAPPLACWLPHAHPALPLLTSLGRPRPWPPSPSPYLQPNQGQAPNWSGHSLLEASQPQWGLAVGQTHSSGGRGGPQLLQGMAGAAEAAQHRQWLGPGPDLPPASPQQPGPRAGLSPLTLPGPHPPLPPPPQQLVPPFEQSPPPPPLPARPCSPPSPSQRPSWLLPGTLGASSLASLAASSLMMEGEDSPGLGQVSMGATGPLLDSLSPRDPVSLMATSLCSLGGGPGSMLGHALPLPALEEGCEPFSELLRCSTLSGLGGMEGWGGGGRGSCSLGALAMELGSSSGLPSASLGGSSPDGPLGMSPDPTWHGAQQHAGGAGGEGRSRVLALTLPEDGLPALQPAGGRTPGGEGGRRPELQAGSTLELMLAMFRDSELGGGGEDGPGAAPAQQPAVPQPARPCPVSPQTSSPAPQPLTQALAAAAVDPPPTAVSQAAPLLPGALPAPGLPPARPFFPRPLNPPDMPFVANPQLLLAEVEEPPPQHGLTSHALPSPQPLAPLPLPASPQHPGDPGCSPQGGGPAALTLLGPCHGVQGQQGSSPPPLSPLTSPPEAPPAGGEEGGAQGQPRAAWAGLLGGQQGLGAADMLRCSFSHLSFNEDAVERLQGLCSSQGGLGQSADLSLDSLAWTGG